MSRTDISEGNAIWLNAYMIYSFHFILSSSLMWYFAIGYGLTMISIINILSAPLAWPLYVFFSVDLFNLYGIVISITILLFLRYKSKNNYIDFKKQMLILLVYFVIWWLIFQESINIV